MGLLVAVGVILLLLTANFQSFRLSLAVGLTIPAVIAGVAIMLWLTRTTLNIQSFMGAIMAVGVAVANAILLVTFAERSRIGRPRTLGGGNRRRAEPSASDPDDQLRDDRWHDADGARARRRRRANCAAWAGGDRRFDLGATCATLIVLPAIFTVLPWKAAAFPRRSILTTLRARISIRESQR